MSNIQAIRTRFGTQPFSYAEAREAGISAGALRNPRLVIPYRGTRAFGEIADSLVARSHSYLPRLRRGECFSHETALALYGCPIRVPCDHRVDVESRLASGQVRCTGVRGHRRKRAERIAWLAVPGGAMGIPVVEPLQALLQVAAAGTPFTELVVALDHLRGPGTTPRPLTQDRLQAFQAGVTGPGSRRLRIAIELCRAGAESRMETLTRLAGERVGISDLSLQHEIRDARGAWIGRFDLVDVRARRIIEYDGDHHRLLRSQYLRDLRRLDAARDDGWRVLVVQREDLWRNDRALPQRLLAFLGREARRVPQERARLLSESYPPGLPTSSATPWNVPQA